VFALNPKSGKEAVLWSFGSPGDGIYPSAGLIDVGGVLYGTTGAGGGNGGQIGEGTVFALNPKTGKEAVVWSFGAFGDGEIPYAGLLDVSGVLYGTTVQGGANGLGTVFALNSQTGEESVLWSFGSVGDGTFPFAGLIDIGGVLYGSTSGGGSGGYGTVFALNSQTSKETVLWSFGNAGDGVSPQAGLIYIGGVLYGTTTGGGTHGGGTVFSLNPKNGKEAVLWSFGSAGDGVSPQAGLIKVGRALYGTTGGGGAHGAGTVFSLAP
jgi:uncharacterized repeat protein (TIGR03803 family)